MPTAVSVFPDELYQTTRAWAERAYPNLIHYNKVAKGGHFAAWEQPRALHEGASRGLQVTSQLSGLRGIGARPKRALIQRRTERAA